MTSAPGPAPTATTGPTPLGRRLLVGCAVAFVLAAGLVLGGIWWLLYLPSEAQLVEQFQQHRPLLDELKRMADEDHLTTIRMRGGQIAWLVVLDGERPVRKEPGEFPEARRRAYLDLMKRAGIAYGLDQGDFLAGSQGSHRKALHVGFTHCPAQGDFVASLDDADGFSTPRWFYRRLEGPWCIVLKGGD